jgi:hypothetical protein
MCENLSTSIRFPPNLFLDFFVIKLQGRTVANV